MKMTKKLKINDFFEEFPELEKMEEYNSMSEEGQETKKVVGHLKDQVKMTKKTMQTMKKKAQM